LKAYISLAGETIVRRDWQKPFLCSAVRWRHQAGGQGVEQARRGGGPASVLKAGVRPASTAACINVCEAPFLLMDYVLTRLYISIFSMTNDHYLGVKKKKVFLHLLKNLTKMYVD
jgi:hypothetical protein